MTRKTTARIVDQRTPAERGRPFLPGMARAWLMPFYDLFSRVAGADALHRRAVELVDIAPGQTVLDVGCGTGNLSLALLRAQPAARVTGLDPDGAALRRAARKAGRRGVDLTLVQGYADRLPADDASLDHVVTSLALHHLDDAGRVAFAGDAMRALRPGGEVTVVDFGEAASGSDHAHHHGRGHSALGHLPQLLSLLGRNRRDRIRSQSVGSGIVSLLAAAGFEDAREVAHLDHRFGPITFVRASRARGL
ncbi:class I SAM-dependent methyltransferase [Intrasporangium sp. DVR]|uniref:class I SAM-dependent methyltransferase n=1 Tax=Intrasporangium sp. DVR TaxID=3127867 RepID=UPI00313A6990